MHPRHLLGVQHHRRTEQPRLRIHLRQRLDLHRERQRLGYITAEREDPMVREETGASVGERGDGMIGERLRPEGRVGRAADVVATRHRDHVVEGGDPLALYLREHRERGRMRRMRMHHRLDLRSRHVDIAMHPPLR